MGYLGSTKNYNLGSAIIASHTQVPLTARRGKGSWLGYTKQKSRLGEFRAWSQRRQSHPTPVLLPGKPHGQRSLVGSSPWGRQESGRTERLHFHFSLSCIGEGNGTPLQCSCLENPRDGGAWWAAVYRVAQSRTRLTRLSSSSILLIVLRSLYCRVNIR